MKVLLCAVAQPVVAAVTTVKPAVYGAGVPQLSEEQRRRAEAAVARKFGAGDGGADVGVGAKLMARMGFGATEGSKGGLGINEHVCCIRVVSRSQWFLCIADVSGSTVAPFEDPSSALKRTCHSRPHGPTPRFGCVAP